MFGHDRFGEDQDYFKTYQTLGGQDLDKKKVHQIVAAGTEIILRKYDDAAWQDKFPGVRDTLRQLPCAIGMLALEIDLITNVIACHEIGTVSKPYQQLLKQLSSTHQLGVVSNIWAEKKRWLDLFEEYQILDLFEVLIFSSDGPHIKPSMLLFEQAIDRLDVNSQRILFVGDDPKRDIKPALDLGMATLLVGAEGGSDAHWHLPKLTDLVN